MKKQKINIGFDIGVNSVGWSILDENHNIIDLGVRLFDDVANPKDGKLLSGERRDARSTRRRIRRQKTRKEDFKKLLLANKIVDSYEEIQKLIDIDITKWNIDNPIQLKVKAIYEEISKEQLIFILYHYLHHRGFFHIDDETETEKNKLSLDNLESSNKKYPSEEILEFYQTHQYYKGSEITSKIYYGRYENEIKEIFKKQAKYLSFLTEQFQNDYLNLFTRKRDFATGPGSETAPTPWGMWYEDKNGVIQKREGENLWDATIGKCTYFPEENRALKNAASSELFNFFNDLNNLYFFHNNEYRLSKEQKEYIFQKITDAWNKQKNVKMSLKLVSEAYDKFPSIENQELNMNNISGYRFNKSKQPIFTELTNYKTVYCWMNKYQLANFTQILNLETLITIDNFIEEMSKYAHDKIAQKEFVASKYPQLGHEAIEEILKLSGLSKRHSLSIKAMHKYLEYCIDNLEYSKNQMHYFSQFDFKNVKSKNNLTKYLGNNLFIDAVISPTAKRSFNESVKVLNRILEIYGKQYEVNNITIELPRDKNTAEETKNINNSQKYNEELLKNIAKENNYDDKKILTIPSVKKLRLKLWKEQQGIDIYTGNPISFNEALNGTNLEIDHIIPHQISGDDSQSNKVLVTRIENKNKSNLTPYQYFANQNKLEEYINRVNTYFPNESKKRENLLFANDPLNNYQDFIERNLVDTRQAAKVLLNTLQSFFTNNPNYENVKIKVINGSLTNFARYNLLTSNNKIILHKDRDLYCHHAIDAAIVCFLGMNHAIKKITDYYNQQVRYSRSKLTYQKGQIIDTDTGEIIDIKTWTNKDKDIAQFALELAQYNDIWDEENQQIKFAPKHVKFSRKLIHKQNKKLSNETIYSFKWDKDESNNNLTTGVAYKRIGIFDENILKYFKKPKSEKKDIRSDLVIYHQEPNLYKELCNIVNRYPDSIKSPFKEFMKDNYQIKDPKFLLIDNQRIKSLKIIEGQKEESDIIVLKNHNNNAILFSLESLSSRIYKNKHGEYQVIKVNQKVLTYDDRTRNLKINEEKLNKLLEQYDILDKKYIEITNGTIFLHKETNDIFYSIGSFVTGSRFEMKSLKFSNKKFNPENTSGRIYVTLNKLMNEYDIVNVDVLGNIFKNPKNLL